jgi:hypothetical protein
VTTSIVLGKDLPPLPMDLLMARDHGEVLFIVGAGASYPAPSSLPDSGGLVADIYAMSGPLAAVQKKGGPS